MYTAEVKTPVRTDIIRTPVAGPKPCNTLAFIRCNGVGGVIETPIGDFIRYKVRFPTMFRIDGFTQANHEWYRRNTLVSATAFIRILNITTDIEFGFAIDSIVSDINADGRLVFELQLAQQLDGPGLFEKEADSAFTYTVSAYVLLFEPRVEPPPPGNFGKELFVDVMPFQFGRKREFITADEARMKWTLNK
jgi:hypothetical protein